MLRIRIPVRTGKKGLVTITQSVLPALPLLPSALAPLLPSALAPLLPSALAPLLPPTPAPSLDQKLAAEMEAIHHLIQSDVGRNVVDVVRMEIAKNSKKHNTRLHCDKIRELIASGANIELKGFSEYTPLCLAVFVADDELVQFLLGRGANIDAVVHEGQTVLHLAIVGRNVNVAAAVVREILKNPERVQEKINRKNIYGEAPLSYAIALGFERSFIQMIILAGADCNAARNDGKTVLDLLAHVRDREVVSVITDAISRQTQPENFVKNTLDMALHLFGMRQISSAEVGSEMADWLVNFAKEKVLEVAKENSKNPQLIA
ncbi:MAG: ankyrin repeat domain-containing protein, partial [Alphaproteobacteria bacterium]|nr:ankyrin repeat domain-containing protein [Alphaproteobacteria bacterium]